MRIKRIEIQNFRNFKHCIIEFGEHAVIVGENKIGKSNLLYALRLIFDSRLSEAERTLRLEDFHDGIARGRDDIIHIAVDLANFEHNADALAVLAEYLVEAEPMVSRLHYLYRPKPGLENEPQREADYEFLIYGGNNPDQRISHELRQQIALTFLPALRDAEGDLNSWRRSPLRPLLESAAAKSNQEQLEQATQEITNATQGVAQLPDIIELATRLQERLKDTVGLLHAVPITLGFLPTDADKLIRTLKLFIDNGARSISEASLGSANLIYLCLWMLELERQIAENDKSHNILAIEEPEAHLHPHLQRLTFRRFLSPRNAGVETGGQAVTNETILLTTHSPHIVSVAPLRSLVVLRKSTNDTSTEGVSTANLELTESEVKDLERYLDVTRGEIVFAKGVLLVEGIAEEFLIPVFGNQMGYDFDRLGITVCSVNGTDFAPYVKLLGRHGLQIPYAIITDFDPKSDGTESYGVARTRKLLELITGDASFAAAEEEVILRNALNNGIFINRHTLEVDLFFTGQHEAICETITELTSNGAAIKRAEEWRESPELLAEPENVTQLLKDIEKIGKGRFAQRLSINIKPDSRPPYIENAINYVASFINQPEA